jgi:hypothetical protein
VRLPGRLRAALDRFLAAVRFVLGAALAAVPVGAAIGALVPIPELPLLPQTAPWANRLVAITELALAGWFVGLLWGVLLLVWGRRLAPAAPPHARSRALAIGMGAALLAGVAALLAHLTLPWAVGVAVTAATGAALATLLAVRSHR